MVDNFIHGGKIPSAPAPRIDVTDELLGIEPLVFRKFLGIGDGGDDRPVCQGEGVRELALKNVTAGRIRAR